MSKFDKTKYDAKAATEARKKELAEITEKLEAGVKEIFNGENFKDYLNFCAKLPNYSINNQILIMLQKPDATMVQSFTAWKNVGRNVKKGEKGIRIMAPSPFKVKKEREKTDESGNIILNSNGVPETEEFEMTVNSFKCVSTFDLNQTEGKPIPSLGIDELDGNVEGYDAFFEALKSISTGSIIIKDISSGAKGFYSIDDDIITIKEGMSQIQTIKTLIHESAHQALHSKEATKDEKKHKTQNQRETEAESVAYVVCKHFNIDTSEYSFSYLASWSSGKEVTELKASLDTIRKTASDMIDKIESYLQSNSKSELSSPEIEIVA